jgi:hypothetical protein
LLSCPNGAKAVLSNRQPPAKGAVEHRAPKAEDGGGAIGAETAGDRWISDALPKS